MKRSAKHKPFISEEWKTCCCCFRRGNLKRSGAKITTYSAAHGWTYTYLSIWRDRGSSRLEVITQIFDYELFTKAIQNCTTFQSTRRERRRHVQNILRLQMDRIAPTSSKFLPSIRVGVGSSQFGEKWHSRHHGRKRVPRNFFFLSWNWIMPMFHEFLRLFYFLK